MFDLESAMATMQILQKAQNCLEMQRKEHGQKEWLYWSEWPERTSGPIAKCDLESINPALGHIRPTEGKHTYVKPTTDKYKKLEAF